MQENLIDVETQAFSGKMQIIRSMLSKYSTDFEKYINPPEQKQEQEQEHEDKLKTEEEEKFHIQ